MIHLAAPSGNFPPKKIQKIAVQSSLAAENGKWGDVSLKNEIILGPALLRIPFRYYSAKIGEYEAEASALSNSDLALSYSTQGSNVAINVASAGKRETK